jgi:hypothetical protein
MKMSYYERNKTKILSNLRDKYQKDEEYRSRIQEKYRQRYHEDEEYRNATVSCPKIRLPKNITFLKIQL